MSDTVTIQDENLSVAWARGLKEFIVHEELAPLVVIVTGFEDGIPFEIPEIRSALDQAYIDRSVQSSCHTVANTIFPSSMWNMRMSREDLYDRYRRILPRLRRHTRNRYGLYFERMISFGNSGPPYVGKNQLEQILQNWNRGVHRRSALQAMIFDPTKDLAPQRLRGFPCLQQVSFAPEGSDGLSVTGYYTMQYFFERAYGNYLGLCNLGRFMAHEMGRNLTQMTCIANFASRDVPVYVLRRLENTVGQILQDHMLGDVNV